MKTADLLGSLPPLPEEDLTSKIHELLIDSGKTIVVLDDDPTGTQTVFDVPVLTALDRESIHEALEEEPPVLFLLTNSRALTPEETTHLHRDLGEILRDYRDDIIVLSRSDSTLRGHFPLETDILAEALDLRNAPTLFIPFFEAGGRFTVNDTHYVVEGDTATPAHLTPFANDNSFPFSHSHLPDYIEEKSQGRIPAAEVQSISIDDLRTGDVEKRLADLPDGSTCIINAASLHDLNTLSAAIHQSDRPFIIRCAASFVQSLAGIISRPSLEPWQMQDLDENPNGGLIVVGSHVPKTTTQLNHLIENAPEATPIELDVPALLKNSEETLTPLIDQLNEVIKSGNTAILYTSRKRIDAREKTRNLDISQTVSNALVSLVQSVKARPAFFIAKGGITSSDIGTEALGIKKAMVLGQILAGVPVWTLGVETRHPGLAYVIFPGNVGNDAALTRAYHKLSTDTL